MSEYEVAYREAIDDAIDTIERFNVMLTPEQIKEISRFLEAMADRIAPQGAR